MNRTKFWRRTNFTLLIIGVLVVVVLLNILVSAVAGSWQIDLTKEGYFSLSDTTLELLERTKTPVEIAVLSEESDVDPHLTELFSLYAQNGNTVTLNYIDPVRDPAYAKDLPSDVANRLTTGSVWVTAEGRYRVFSSGDLISYDEIGNVQSMNAEQRLTSAISYVVEPSDDTITFIGGATSSLVSLFENENYNVSFLDSLRVGDLDENTRAVIYIMPQSDLSIEEIAKLETFLNGGGRVAFFFGADSPTETPILDDFLYKWNIRLDRNLILDPENCLNQNPYYLLGQSLDIELLDGANSSAVFLVPQAQSLSILEDQANHYVDTETLITSYDTAMTQSKTGEQIIGAVSKKYQGTDTVGKVFVSGSYMLLHNDLMTDSAYANGSFITNLMRDLLDREDSVHIAQKVSGSSTVPMSNGMYWILTVLVILVIPAVIAVIGIIAFRKRRYL